ncbi:hypothetical protein [Pectinatus haikarae]|nr:hypothetical protein [Pectinatus haikarae]
MANPSIALAHSGALLDIAVNTIAEAYYFRSSAIFRYSNRKSYDFFGTI